MLYESRTFPSYYVRKYTLIILRRSKHACPFIVNEGVLAYILHTERSLMEISEESYNLAQNCNMG